MKPKLVPMPGRALCRAYSIWPVYVAGLLGILPYIIPYLDGVIPHWLSIVILCLSPIGLVIDQGGFDADK